jgi:hypothetical protein
LAEDLQATPTVGPTETREAEAYVFRWPTGYGLKLSNITEDREGLEAEAAAFGESRGRRVLVHTARLRLLGTNSKRDLARHLHEQTKSLGLNGSEFDWKTYIEVAAHRTREMFREGEPVVELADVTPVPQEYLLDAIIPAGRTSLIFGDGSSTKSIQAMAMAMAVATGLAVGPYKPLTCGPVLYLDAETDSEEQSERADRIARGLGLPGTPRGLHYQQQLRSLTQSRAGILAAAERIGAVFVIVDSAAAVANGSVNEDQVAIAIMNALRNLRAITRLLISHVSKAVAAQEKGRGRAMGNIYFENYSRSILEAKRVGTDKADFEVGLYHRKLNRGALRDAFAVRMRFDDPMGPITFQERRITEIPELASYGNDAEQILSAFVAAGGAINLPDLVIATGMKESTLRYRLAKMPNRVTQIAGGKGRGNIARYALLSERAAEAS